MPRLRALATAALLAASPARAGPRVPPIALSYARAPGAEACPDADELRRAVIKEMGYDPFAAEPPADASRLQVTIARRAGRLTVEMEMRDGAGRVLWSVDHLRSGGDCRTLVEAAGLAIAVRVDPGPAPAPACPEPPPPAAPPAAPPAPPPAPAGPPRPPAKAEDPAILLRIGAGAFAAVASPPAIAPGVAAIGEVRGPLGSIAIEARAVLPGAGGRQGQRVDATTVAGVIAPCAAIGPVVGCALAEGGAVVLTGPAVPAARALGLLGAGFRAGYERAISPRVVLRAHADLLGTLTHEQALLRSAFIWSGPDAVGTIGIEVMTIASRGSLSRSRGVSSTKSSPSYEAP
jgi:hypothetical protein